MSVFVFFTGYGAPQELHVRTHSFPSRRSSDLDRPAIAIDPHDVDVARALRLALGQDQRAFVDHRIEGAFDDFGIADRALLDPRLLAELVDDLGDAGALRRDRKSTRLNSSH